jgi:hypothetical protein
VGNGVNKKILIDNSRAICGVSEQIFELSSIESEGIQRFLCVEVIQWLVNIHPKDKSHEESKIVLHDDLNDMSNDEFEVEANEEFKIKKKVQDFTIQKKSRL